MSTTGDITCVSDSWSHSRKCNYFGSGLITENHHRNNQLCLVYNAKMLRYESSSLVFRTVLVLNVSVWAARRGTTESCSGAVTPIGGASGRSLESAAQTLHRSAEDVFELLLEGSWWSPGSRELRSRFINPCGWVNKLMGPQRMNQYHCISGMFCLITSGRDSVGCSSLLWSKLHCRASPLICLWKQWPSYITTFFTYFPKKRFEQDISAF